MCVCVREREYVFVVAVEQNGHKAQPPRGETAAVVLELSSDLTSCGRWPLRVRLATLRELRSNTECRLKLLYFTHTGQVKHTTVRLKMFRCCTLGILLGVNLG